MKQKINSVLQQVLKEIKPSKEEFKNIEESLDELLKKLNKNIKNTKINAEIFVGGSFAKKTVIKKGDYDVDIFIRFDKKYNDNEIPDLTYKILKDFKTFRVHGSRDYFRIEIIPETFFEVIPVVKIKKPEEARNITDLSYFHVKYINKKIKSEKVLGDILLAKKFCYANKCYGAESYIKGFSGYALELLIYYYGSFLKFIKKIASIDKDEKTIIDIEKHYKNRQRIMMDLNSSKLKSPIILIDPTFKQRNALATLSYETLGEFRKACKQFLKNPGVKSFESRKANYNKIKQDAEKKNFEFVLIKAETDKQEGNIAGSKLLKFYNYLTGEMQKYFEIKDKGFQYNDDKTADYFFVVKNRKEILFSGPKTEDKINAGRFRQRHRNTFLKSGRIYAREKTYENAKDFINKWEKGNAQRMKEMYINRLEITENMQL